MSSARSHELNILGPEYEARACLSQTQDEIAVVVCDNSSGYQIGLVLYRRFSAGALVPLS